MASWDVLSIIFVLVSLGDLGVEIEEALVDWIDLDEFVKSIVNKLRDVFGIILMLVSDVGAIFWEIIGVVLVVLDIGAFFWEVISVVLVILDIGAILEEVIGVFFVILELNQRASVVFLMTFVMS